MTHGAMNLKFYWKVLPKFASKLQFWSIRDKKKKKQGHLTWGPAKQISAQLEQIWLSICQADKTFDIKVMLENDTRLAQHSSGDSIRLRHPYLYIKSTQLIPQFNKIWDVTESLSDPHQYQISQKSVVIVFVLGLLHVVRRKGMANLTEAVL